MIDVVLPLGVHVVIDLLVGDGQHHDEDPQEDHADHELVEDPHGDHGLVDHVSPCLPDESAGGHIVPGQPGQVVGCHHLDPEAHLLFIFFTDFFCLSNSFYAPVNPRTENRILHSSDTLKIKSFEDLVTQKGLLWC